MRAYIVAAIAIFLVGCSSTTTTTVKPSVLTISPVLDCSYYQSIDPDGQIVLVTNTGPECRGDAMANLLRDYTPDSDVPWVSTLILSGGTPVATVVSPDLADVARISRVGSGPAVSAAAVGLLRAFQAHGWSPV